MQKLPLTESGQADTRINCAISAYEAWEADHMAMDDQWETLGPTAVRGLVFAVIGAYLNPKLLKEHAKGQSPGEDFISFGM
jgi:hypothetical protein